MPLSAGSETLSATSEPLPAAYEALSAASEDAVLEIGVEKVEDAIGAMQGNEDCYK